MSGAHMRPLAALLHNMEARNGCHCGNLALPAKAGEAGAPGVHMVHEGRAGGLSHASGGAVIDAARPRAGEEIRRRPLPKTFARARRDGLPKQPRQNDPVHDPLRGAVAAHPLRRGALAELADRLAIVAAPAQLGGT
jgi:hypothetical protein